MTVYQIRQAASMWLYGKDTAHMAAILGIPERRIWWRMDTIRREARKMAARAAA
ncbi:hypothetical protein ACN6KF_003027 [Labrys sp. La1]|uniref:hypothetical protein n=1 Tax=Labrys sp. La1 TaxID=3404917 RepID=UPI003EBD206E